MALTGIIGRKTRRHITGLGGAKKTQVKHRFVSKCKESVAYATTWVHRKQQLADTQPKNEAVLVNKRDHGILRKRLHLWVSNAIIRHGNAPRTDDAGPPPSLGDGPRSQAPRASCPSQVHRRLPHEERLSAVVGQKHAQGRHRARRNCSAEAHAGLRLRCVS